MPSTNGEQSIDVRINTILGKVKVEDEVVLSLSMWQWTVLAKHAERNDVSVSRVVERWVSTTLMGMAMGVEPPGDSPSTK